MNEILICDYEEKILKKRMKMWVYLRSSPQFKTKLFKKSIKRKNWRRNLSVGIGADIRDIKNNKKTHFSQY